MRRQGINTWPAVLLCSLAIYIPLSSQLFLYWRHRFVTVSYGILILACIVIFFRALLRNRFEISTNNGMFLFFCVLFLFIGSTHVFFGYEELQVFLADNQGFVLSSVLLLYITSFCKSDRLKIFHGLFAVIGLSLVLQLVFSCYESHAGIYMGRQAEWLNNRVFRDSIELRFLGPSWLVGIFSFPLTGMLGQHNYWGTQLPFYNLIFLLGYLTTKENKYYIFAWLALAAALLNTTRFGIAAILVSDLFFFSYMVKWKVKYQMVLKVMLAFFAVLFVGLFIYMAYSHIDAYFARTNTLSQRLENYKLLWNGFFAQHTIHVFFGNSLDNLKSLVFSSLGISTSLESQLFLSLYEYGLIGTAVMLLFLLIFMQRFGKLKSPYKNMGYLLVFNMLMVSVISNLLFDYSSFSIIALIYFYIHSQPSGNFSLARIDHNVMPDKLNSNSEVAYVP